MPRFILSILAAFALLLPSAENAADDPRHLYEQGLQAAQQGRAEAARRFFMEAAERAPDWVLPQLELGALLTSMDGQNLAACAVLARATQLAPDNPRAAFLLGMAYKQAGKAEPATAHLRRVVSLRPDWLEAWLQLGEMLENQGAIAPAIEAYESAAKLNGSDTAARSAMLGRLAFLYERQGDTSRAESAWRALVAAHPRVAYYHYQLAQFYERTGSLSQAKIEFGRASALDPRPARKMRNLK